MVLSKSVRLFLTTVVIASLSTLVLGYAANFRGLDYGNAQILSLYRHSENVAAPDDSIRRDLSDVFVPEAGAAGPDDTPEHFEHFALERIVLDHPGSDDSTRIGGASPLAARSPFHFVPSTPKALTMHLTGRETISLARVLLPSPRSPPSLCA